MNSNFNSEKRLAGASKLANLPPLRDISHLLEVVKTKQLRQVMDRRGYERMMDKKRRLHEEQHLLPEATSYEFDYDFVVENQRGMTLFGIPMFSKHSLLEPLDPPSYQSVNTNNDVLQGYHRAILELYPLPDLLWDWAWDSWCILMNNDVDDQGWIYSRFFFQSSSWHGKSKLGNFVRRRIWVRLRVKPVFEGSHRLPVISEGKPYGTSVPESTTISENPGLPVFRVATETQSVVDKHSGSIRKYSAIRAPRINRRQKYAASSIAFENNDPTIDFLATGFSDECLGETETIADSVTSYRAFSLASKNGSVVFDFPSFLDAVQAMDLDREKISYFLEAIREGVMLSDLRDVDLLTQYLSLLEYDESKSLLCDKLVQWRKDGEADGEFLDELIENMVLITTDAA